MRYGNGIQIYFNKYKIHGLLLVNKLLIGRTKSFIGSL